MAMVFENSAQDRDSWFDGPSIFDSAPSSPNSGVTLMYEGKVALHPGQIPDSPESLPEPNIMDEISDHILGISSLSIHPESENYVTDTTSKTTVVSGPLALSELHSPFLAQPPKFGSERKVVFGSAPTRSCQDLHRDSLASPKLILKNLFVTLSPISPLSDSYTLVSPESPSRYSPRSPSHSRYSRGSISPHSHSPSRSAGRNSSYRFPAEKRPEVSENVPAAILEDAPILRKKSPAVLASNMFSPRLSVKPTFSYLSPPSGYLPVYDQRIPPAAAAANKVTARQQQNERTLATIKPSNVLKVKVFYKGDVVGVKLRKDILSGTSELVDVVRYKLLQRHRLIPKNLTLSISFGDQDLKPVVLGGSGSSFGSFYDDFCMDYVRTKSKLYIRASEPLAEMAEA